MSKIKYRTREDIPDELIWDLIDTSVGKLVVGWNEKKEICRASYLLDLDVEHILRDWELDWRAATMTKGKFQGKLDDKGILLIGTAFQQEVWKEVLKIPAGSTSTYAKIAQAVGRPKAARAVGTACSINPIHYLVPCHRVLHSDGSLCCFHDFHGLQSRLLQAEGVIRC